MDCFEGAPERINRWSDANEGGKRDITSYFIGALSALVPDSEWDSALATATNCYDNATAKAKAKASAKAAVKDAALGANAAMLADRGV